MNEKLESGGKMGDKYCQIGEADCELCTIYNDRITEIPTKCIDEGCQKLTLQRIAALAANARNN
jgi:hypothetical protein